MRRFSNHLPSFASLHAFLILISLGGFLWAATMLSAAEPEIGPHTPLTLETGQGTALVTTNVLLSYDASLSRPSVRFDFSFGTDETNAPSSIPDAFSVNLQNPTNAAIALVLTADRTGVAWAPTNAGGVSIVSEDVQRRPIVSTNGTAGFDWQIAYAVLVRLPQELISTGVRLFLDLFDNQNGLGSLASVVGIRIISGGAANLLYLQSAAVVQGPYADEGGVIPDMVNGKIVLPVMGYHRFFRLRSDSEVVITRLRLGDTAVVLEYEFPAAVIALQSAASPEGPFIDETNAVVDVAAQTIRLAGPPQQRHYRLRANVRVDITGTEVQPNQLVLTFMLRPAVLALQSSAAGVGPYTDESNAIIDPAQRSVTLFWADSTRFYRLRSDQARRITGLRVTGANVELSFE